VLICDFTFVDLKSNEHPIGIQNYCSGEHEPSRDGQSCRGEGYLESRDDTSEAAADCEYCYCPTEPRRNRCTQKKDWIKAAVVGLATYFDSKTHCRGIASLERNNFSAVPWHHFALKTVCS